ncbi:helix-turn-helix domain-containing protein [Vibrio cholerae]|nr:helix-turn-helix domain-containing protein [Salmonella enterica]EGZ6890230.1 helix-turn-helix domain-containing protein [Vibrio cholerae]HCG7492697.1 helix-turn-helix domain-containing protein [Vibrio parahaemolyticus]
MHIRRKIFNSILTIRIDARLFSTDYKMMNFGNVIRRLRKAKGWTLQRVCEEMNGAIQTGHLSRVERGELTPSVYIARNIARALGTSLDSMLAEADGGPLAQVVPDPAQRVPVLSWVQAGLWTSSPTGVVPELCDKWVVAPRAKLPPRCYALEVRGDSMQAQYGMSFPEGCYIIVDPNRVPENKSFVVAMQTNAEEATFKQLIIEGADKYLKPLNPQYPLLKIDQEVITCGVVIDMVCHLANGH